MAEIVTRQRRFPKGALTLMSFGFKDASPAHTDFQFLEELSTAYWYSQVLFTALELKLFLYMDQGHCSVDKLARAASCREPELIRLLKAMERTGLVTCKEEYWYNSQVSSMFLVPDKRDYMGDFFLYRQYMAPRWEKLTEAVSLEKAKEIAEPSYKERNLRYVASTDTLVRQKSREIVQLL